MAQHLQLLQHAQKFSALLLFLNRLIDKSEERVVAGSTVCLSIAGKLPPHTCSSPEEG
jgi:hypothetical protein